MSRKRTTYSAEFLKESHHFVTASLDKKAKVEQNTIWLTQKQIADVFEVTKQNMVLSKKVWVNLL